MSKEKQRSEEDPRGKGKADTWKGTWRGKGHGTTQETTRIEGENGKGSMEEKRNYSRPEQKEKPRPQEPPCQHHYANA